MLVSSLEWSLLVAKGAQIDQTPALPTKVKILPSKRLIFLFVDLLIQIFWVLSLLDNTKNPIYFAVIGRTNRVNVELGFYPREPLQRTCVRYHTQ